MNKLKLQIKNVKGKFVNTEATTVRDDETYMHDAFGLILPLHMNLDTKWVVKLLDTNGRTATVDKKEIKEIYFVSITKDNHISPLHRKHYKRVMNKNYIEFQSIVDCVLCTPIFDVSGKSHSKECIKCEAWFDASSKQKHCESCNTMMHHVILSTNQTTKSLNKKIDYDEFNSIANDIYLQGVKNDLSFDITTYIRDKFENI